MQPGFVESFFPKRNIDFCKRDANGSNALYPAWHTVDRVFMAINLIHTHWVLGELNLQSWDLTIYDSGGPMFVMQVQNLLNNLINRMHEFLKMIGYFKALKQKPYNPKIKIKHPSYQVPVQSGPLGDCGPWWCIFVEQRT